MFALAVTFFESLSNIPFDCQQTVVEIEVPHVQRATNENLINLCIDCHILSSRAVIYEHDEKCTFYDEIWSLAVDYKTRIVSNRSGRARDLRIVVDHMLAERLRWELLEANKDQ